MICHDGFSLKLIAKRAGAPMINPSEILLYRQTVAYDPVPLYFIAPYIQYL